MKLFLQLHVHSNRSHDSKTTIEEYVNNLNQILPRDGFGILGITDHNITPITTREALAFSNEKVLVVPGIQWKLHKSLGDAIFKLCTRRELLTLGNHDDLREYVLEKTNYKILDNQEILGNFTEEEFLRYLKGNQELILIVPHPRHLGVEFYGQKEISDLKEKIENETTGVPFFVEEKTGYDPFPRLFNGYDHDYLIMGSTDAHEIETIFHKPVLFSVKTYINSSEEIISECKKAISGQNLENYRLAMAKVFKLIQEKNAKIHIDKNYLISTLQFLHSIPAFLKRRFSNFPHNLTH